MEEKKDKNQLKDILFIILYALVGSLVLAFIILLVNCIWPTQNLFKAESWGTISDWFTYLVTLIGGVFIYKTLQSQMEVQKSQSIITQIEINKHLYSIKPIITTSLEFVTEEYDENYDDKVLKFVLKISSDKPMTYKLNLTNNNILNKNQFFNNAKYKHTTPSTSKFYLTMSSSILDSKFPLMLDLKYTDIEGNKYKYRKSQYLRWNNNKIEFPSSIHHDELE